MFSKKFLIIQVFFVIAAVFLLILYLRLPSVPALGVYGQVNDFCLTDSNGQKFGLKDLRGKIWVADFFFTTCGNLCPMMSAHMGHLQEAFKFYKGVRLVSFSVNPEQDTPEVLKKYAQKFHADTNRWIFLTGSRQDMTRVVVNSFKLGDIKDPIFHSPYFVLLDKEGKIRGYYDSSDTKSLDKVITDLRQLLKSG